MTTETCVSVLEWCNDSRLQVDDVEDVHNNRQVIHGDGRVQGALRTGRRQEVFTEQGNTNTMRCGWKCQHKVSKWRPCWDSVVWINKVLEFTQYYSTYGVVHQNKNIWTATVSNVMPFFLFFTHPNRAVNKSSVESVWSDTAKKKERELVFLSLRIRLHWGQSLTFMSSRAHTARIVSRFLCRLLSITHMVSWPFLIWDRASSSLRAPGLLLGEDWETVRHRNKVGLRVSCRITRIKHQK